VHVSGMILEAAAGIECLLLLAGRPETELSPPCPQLVRATFCGSRVLRSASVASEHFEHTRLQLLVVIAWQTVHTTHVRR
jgi:hypothetical protein